MALYCNMIVHLIDGTYELFRQFYGIRRFGKRDDRPFAAVNGGNADQVIAGRKSVLREAWAAHPERFVRGVPKPKPLPEAVFINPPIPSLTTQDIAL